MKRSETYLSRFLLALIVLCLPLSLTVSPAHSECVWGSDRLMSEVDGLFSNEPDVASAGNYVHMVWQDYKDIPNQVHTSRIWYRRSADNGATWENMKAIIPKSSPGDFHDPHIAVNGKSIHVVFIDIGIIGSDMVAGVYYMKSTNNGQSWSRPVLMNMSWGHPSYEAWYPDVSVSGDCVHVVWVDDREANDDFHVYYKRSTDNGRAWDDGDEDPANDNADHSKKITSGTGDFLYPTIHAYGNKVNVAWQWEWEQVYYSGSLDNGGTWSMPLMLAGEMARYPDIRTYDNMVHIVWEDDRHLTQEDCNSEIYYQRSADSGLTWEPATRLTQESMWSVQPKIDLFENRIAVIWKDERDSPLDCGVIGPMPMGEIYYKRSMDGGSSWDDGDDDPLNDNADHTKRLSEIDEIGGHGKAVSVGAKYTHVVFDDARYDAPDPSAIFVKDVFYKQGACP